MKPDAIPQQVRYAVSDFDAARVADVMHPGVLTCPPETPLTVVGRMMSRYRVHAIVVTDFEGEGEGEQPWRVVSDLDVAAAIAAGEFTEMSAGGVAATEVLTIDADEPLREAARLMSEHADAHLLVTASGGTPVGIVSTLDLAAAMPGAS